MLIRPIVVKFGAKQTEMTFKDIFADENQEKTEKLLRSETSGVIFWNLV
jgi:hypothetical protein